MQVQCPGKHPAPRKTKNDLAQGVSSVLTLRNPDSACGETVEGSILSHLHSKQAWVRTGASRRRVFPAVRRSGCEWDSADVPAGGTLKALAARPRGTCPNVIEGHLRGKKKLKVTPAEFFSFSF